MAQKSKDIVLDTLKDCYKSGDFSDLIVTCGADTHRVHKVIVCKRADFFLRAVRFGGKEATESKIDLPDDEPAIVTLLIEYLYEGEYEPHLDDFPTSGTSTTADMSHLVVVKTDLRNTTYNKDYTYGFPHTCRGTYAHICCSSVGESCICPHHICGGACQNDCRNFICTQCTRLVIEGPSDQLLTHAKMYEIADKYDVDGLKDIARIKFEIACAGHWDDDNFPVAAHHAFSTTMVHDKGLRDIVVGTICNHMELIHKPAIETLMTEFNGLSFGILKKKADEHGWGKKQ